MHVDERRAHQLRLLTKLSRELTKALSSDAIARAGTAYAVEMMSAKASVLLTNDADGELVLRGSHGLSDERVASVVRRKGPVQGVLEELVGSPFLSVPLVMRDRVAGVLAVDHPSNRHTPEDEWVLSAVADQIAVALDAAASDPAHDRQLHELLLEAASDYAIASLDPDGNVEAWNAAAHRLFGHETREIVGQPIDVFYSREPFERPQPILAWARQSGRFEEERQLYRKDGSSFWGQVIVAMLRAERTEGGPRGFALLVRDITPRKRSEEREMELAREQRARETAESAIQRLRDIVAQMPVGVLVVEAPSGVVLFDNEEAAKIFDAPLIEGATLRNYRQQRGFRPDGREYGPEDWPLHRAVRDGYAVDAEDITLRHEDGAINVVTVRATPIIVHDTVIAGVATFVDVTRARRHEEFQRQLIGIVSHDLRNPLGVVMTAASTLILGKDVDPKVADRARRITNASNRMERIISDLVDYTMAQVGAGLPISTRQTSIHTVCAESIESMRSRGRIIYDGDGDPTGHWDPERLAQVLENFLTNAFKYGAKDRPVTVRWWREGTDEEHGEDLLLEVHNEGAPIPLDVLPRIFEPFSRGAQTASTVKQSLGLGLFIVREIVRAHGGTVSAASDERDGTTFRVRLPRDAATRTASTLHV